MPTTTVRIDEQTHEKLRTLSCEMSASMQYVLAEAIEAFRRERFLEEANREYARLRADPVVWQELLDERAEWDCTLTDGLEDDVYPLDDD